MHQSDERALWLARNVLPHEPGLRAWLLRRQVEGLEIDDIVQETYTRLSLLVSVNEVRNVRNYVFQTANSIIMSHLRHARVVPMHSLSQLESVDFELDEPDPETVAVDRDELRRVAEAIAQLPPKAREVFMLRRIQGLSQKIVAERLKISEGTVEKQMSKCFHRLADIFGRGGKASPQASSKHASSKIAQAKENMHGQSDKPGD